MIIMYRVVVVLFLLSLSNIYSQHTFSIVAVDTLTGEIGSAGATCGDSIIWPGTPGAYIISDILPGVEKVPFILNHFGSLKPSKC